MPSDKTCTSFWEGKLSPDPRVDSEFFSKLSQSYSKSGAGHPNQIRWHYSSHLLQVHTSYNQQSFDEVQHLHLGFLLILPSPRPTAKPRKYWPQHQATGPQKGREGVLSSPNYGVPAAPRITSVPKMSRGQTTRSAAFSLKL